MATILEAAVRAITWTDFLARAKAKHGDKYTYGKEPKAFRIDSGIIRVKCPEHGWFKQKPRDHITNGGCAACGQLQRGLSRAVPSEELRERFLKAGRELHGGKYQYPKSFKGKTARSSIRIVCPEHGAFYQAAHGHCVMGHGCRSCAIREVNSRPGHREKLSAARKKNGKEWRRSISRTSFERKNVVTQGGRTFSVQGYEDKGLKWLLASGLKPAQVVNGKLVPIIYYTDQEGVERYHKADFYVPDAEKLIEVKSPFTLGVQGKDNNLLLDVRLKAKAAIAARYKYQLLLVKRDGTVIVPPKNWHSLSRRELTKKLGLSP